MLKELSLLQCLDNDEYVIRVNKKELKVLSDDEKYTILAFKLELTEKKELLLLQYYLQGFLGNVIGFRFSYPQL